MRKIRKLIRWVKKWNHIRKGGLIASTLKYSADSTPEDPKRIIKMCFFKLHLQSEDVGVTSEDYLNDLYTVKLTYSRK